MNSIGALEKISRPLILTEIEEVQVCLGHKDLFCEYKKREDAKNTGFKWLEKKKNDPIVKNCRFEIEEKSSKEKLLFYCFEHVNDVSDCSHHKIDVIRRTHNLIVTEIYEKAPTQNE